MEDIDADFVNKVKEGDIMVAEKNFGCGSSDVYKRQKHNRITPFHGIFDAIYNKNSLACRNKKQTVGFTHCGFDFKINILSLIHIYFFSHIYKEIHKRN